MAITITLDEKNATALIEMLLKEASPKVRQHAADRAILGALENMSASKLSKAIHEQIVDDGVQSIRPALKAAVSKESQQVSAVIRALTEEFDATGKMTSFLEKELESRMEAAKTVLDAEILRAKSKANDTTLDITRAREDILEKLADVSRDIESAVAFSKDPSFMSLVGKVCTALAKEIGFTPEGRQVDAK